ncbi:hypothetical protein GCM10009868_40400 [Terrabacter aerolatus]|uniref:Uncharacterized protein n=1 Tax=Terrabacter aerolatus TaxID=422442 RepID=A0A512D673_9MICO|nr:hypothetical protein TAE01_37830 [Terrabacter aerolatus]
MRHAQASFAGGEHLLHIARGSARPHGVFTVSWILSSEKRNGEFAASGALHRAWESFGTVLCAVMNRSHCDSSMGSGGADGGLEVMAPKSPSLTSPGLHPAQGGLFGIW